MRDLIFIIETPRCGDLGHRLLVSRPIFEELEFFQIASSASEKPIGKNFVSVSRNVIQKLSNGTTRIGTEKIILFGLETKELELSKVELIKNQLESFYSNLDEMVAQTDWNFEQSSTMLVRRELQEWLKYPVLRICPNPR